MSDDIDTLIDEAESRTDPSVPADRLANGGDLIRRLARVLREARTQADALTAERDEILRESQEAHRLLEAAEQSAESAWARVRASEAERDRLTGPEMRERIRHALEAGRLGPGFTVLGSQADAIMSLLRGEG